MNSTTTTTRMPLLRRSRITPEAPARSQGPPPRAPTPPTLDRHPPSNPRYEHHARACFSKLPLMLFAPTDHHGQSGCLIFPTLAAPVPVCLRCTDRLPTRYARLRPLARSPLSRGCPVPPQLRFPPVAGFGRSASRHESGTGNPITQEGKHDDTTHSQQAVDEVRIGRVKATIWRNQTEDGKPRYNVVFAHLYKDGDTWQSTQSFGRHDLLLLAKVADLAHTRVLELSQESNGDDNGAAE